MNISIISIFNTWENQQMMKALEDRGVRSTSESPRRLLFAMEEKDFLNPEYDLLLNRVDITSYLQFPERQIRILEYIEEFVPIVNNIDSTLVAINKFSTYLKLKGAGLPVPNSYIITSSSNVDAILKKIRTPFVCKPIIGTRGFDVILFQDKKIYKFYRGTLINADYMIQEYVETGGRDIRVFVVGGEAIGAIWKIAPEGEWRTNISRGGKAEAMELNEELEELCLKSARTIGVEVCGVDVVQDEKGYKIIEVNAVPDFRGFFDAKGINPAEYIADYAIQKVKK
ncbi:MAG: RimK family alpha-L-glutamate ligase [Candidatus Hydrothermarchaeales archaeon]